MFPINYSDCFLFPYANHGTSVRVQVLCNDDKLLVVMSIDNHKQKGEEEEGKTTEGREDSFIDDTVQMNFFICLMHMRDSSTDAVNEKERRKQNTKKIVQYMCMWNCSNLNDRWLQANNKHLDFSLLSFDV